MMDRCYCAECAKLDRMRLQGIAGTFQMRLIAGECRGDRQAPPPPAPNVAGVEGLPLFDGELEPVLF